MRVFGVAVVHNEADIIRLTVLHHLAAGLDRLLIVDNGSTDGTDRILRQLARDGRVDWSRDEGAWRAGEMLTTLARRAAAEGADWVIPFDADEFWYAPQRSIRQVLETSTAAALRIHAVDYIQRREQLRSSPDALQHMTGGLPDRLARFGRDWEVVETEQASYVEAKRSPKWISRASATITLSCGNHIVTGISGRYDETDEIVCLHAPLRSRERLETKARRVPSTDTPPSKGSWHFGRWRALEAAAELDREWAAIVTPTAAWTSTGSCIRWSSIRPCAIWSCRGCPGPGGNRWQSGPLDASGPRMHRTALELHRMRCPLSS